MSSLIKYVPILCIVILALLVAGCTGSQDTSTSTSTPAPTSQAAQSTTTPTSQVSATPNPTSSSTDVYTKSDPIVIEAGSTVFTKYLISDPSKIQADSTAVNWEDFIKNPDLYKNELINLKGDIYSEGNQNMYYASIYYYNVNVNPNLFPGTGQNTQGNNNVPQTVAYAVDYTVNKSHQPVNKIGDEIMMYGVYSKGVLYSVYTIKYNTS